MSASSAVALIARRVQKQTNGICFVQGIAKNLMKLDSGRRKRRMSEQEVRIFMDGNKWCALRGRNLQEGIAGFGDTKEEALADFEKNMQKEIDSSDDRIYQRVEEPERHGSDCGYYVGDVCNCGGVR